MGIEKVREIRKRREGERQWRGVTTLNFGQIQTVYKPFINRLNYTNAVYDMFTVLFTNTFTNLFINIICKRVSLLIFSIESKFEILSSWAWRERSPRTQNVGLECLMSLTIVLFVNFVYNFYLCWSSHHAWRMEWMFVWMFHYIRYDMMRLPKINHGESWNLQSTANEAAWIITWK